MFEIGQKVVCIHEFKRTDRDYDFETFPRKGEIYTIRGVEGSDDKVYFALEEIRNPAAQYDDGDGEATFSSECFRPINERRLDIFRAMLKPVPPKQKEKVE